VASPSIPRDRTSARIALVEQHIQFENEHAFDADDRLAGEKIYYDRGTVLRQLGVFHEPQSILGRMSTLATHPPTIACAIARKLQRK
jgi:hypothetical protein